MMSDPGDENTFKCNCDCGCYKDSGIDLETQCEDCDNGIHYDDLRNVYVDYNEDYS